MTEISNAKYFSVSTTEALIIRAIKDTLNIAGAAISLGIPKTTLSSILAKLERKLKNQIFIRKQGSGEVTITEFGQEVIPKLEKILWISDTMRPKDHEINKRHNAGKISIVSTQTILEGFICPYLAEFLDENPELCVTLTQRDEGLFYHPNINDIFIGCWEHNTENYSYLPFHVFKQRLWASQQYMDQRGPITSIEEVLDHRLVLLKKMSSNEHYFGNDFIVRRLGLPLMAPNIVYVRSGPRILDVVAEQGVGIMVSSEETTKLNGLKLVPVLPDLVGEAVNLFLKIDLNFIETPLACFVTDWIFACRDRALKSIGLSPVWEHNPLFSQEDVNNPL